MKTFILILLFSCGIFCAKSQPSPQLVFEQYHAAKSMNDKADILTSYFENEAKGSFTERIARVIKTLEYFKSKGDIWGTGYIQLGIASGYRLTGQYSSSLKYSLPALKNFEDASDTTAIIEALLQIGSSFTESQNIQQGINYYKKSKSFIEATRDKETYMIVLYKIADCYNKLGLPDSAIAIIDKPLKIAEKEEDTLMLVDYYQITGNAFLAKAEAEKARFFLFKSIDYAYLQNIYNKNTHNTDEYYATIYADLAESFFTSSIYDSVIIYAQKASEYAKPEYKKQLMTAYKWLYKTYEKAGIPDSVNKYYRLSMDIKDALFTSEKNSNIVLMDFQEQLRQEERLAKKIKEAAERRENIEYALISLGIVLLVGLFLLLSRRFIINEKVIKAFGVIALLIIFEFFNLLLHPCLEQITHHSVFLMLIALVILAALLAPCHHKAEKWAVKTLLRKNEAVRLAANEKNGIT